MKETTLEDKHIHRSDGLSYNAFGLMYCKICGENYYKNNPYQVTTPEGE